MSGLTFILSGGAATLARYGGHALQPWQTVLILSEASALRLAVAVYFLGDISAHFNPATTLAFALRRDMGWGDGRRLLGRQFLPGRGVGHRAGSIDEVDVLGHGAMGTLVDGIRAPSTLGRSCARHLGQCPATGGSGRGAAGGAGPPRADAARQGHPGVHRHRLDVKRVYGDAKALTRPPVGDGLVR
jgi:hypothetical protein